VINGPRRVSYGPVEESFDALRQVLSVVLRKKLKEPLDEHDVGLDAETSWFVSPMRMSGTTSEILRARRSH
jgi:hypothetical protein